MVKTKPITVKILFFIDGLIAGGKERRLTQLLDALGSNKDIQFELVLMSNEIHYKEVFDWNINIHYLIRDAKKDVSVFRRFYKICREYKPDIVHCWDSMTAIISVPVCKLLNIKLVNGMVVSTPVKRNIFNKQWFRAKLTFPFSDMVIGNSRAGLAAYRAPVKKSCCIYNGVDLSRFNNLKNPSSFRKEIFGEDSDNIFIAGMVAAFEERKDYKLLIEAAVTLISRHDNIRFVLVGDGVNFNKIKSIVPVPLLNKIIFLGKRSDIESIVNIFDLGILLTNTKVHGEGISNSIIEYMALLKPVIATRGGGTNEVVIDNQNGYLIDTDNSAHLVEKIETLMKNKNLVDELGKKGNQMVHEKFDIRIMTNYYINVYNKLFKEKKT
jgi:glycosyltransferase involved in cell wall biosynthesis